MSQKWIEPGNLQTGSAYCFVSKLETDQRWFDIGAKVSGAKLRRANQAHGFGWYLASAAGLVNGFSAIFFAVMRLVNHSSELIHQIYQREHVDDVVREAREAGNSPGMNFKH